MPSVIMRMAGIKAGRTRNKQPAPAWLDAALNARQPAKKGDVNAIALIKELSEVDATAAKAAVAAGLSAGEFTVAGISEAGLAHLMPPQASQAPDAPQAPQGKRK